jgi:hypothetical protein
MGGAWRSAAVFTPHSSVGTSVWAWGAVVPRTAPPRWPHDRQGRGDSADGPSSRTVGHSANRWWVPHRGCVSGAFHIDGMDADS